MATVKYTGARYITKFFDNGSQENPSEWQANTAYEQIVACTYQGNTYISKQPVPRGVGNPAANPDYWLHWADPNAQMEQLRQIVESFDNRILTNTDDIASLDIKKQNAYPKFAIIGDSWSATNEAGTYGLWVNAFEFYTGLTPIRLAVSGSGFTRGGVNNFLGQLTALSQREDLDEIGFVILYGGVNDWRYNATVETMKAEIQSFRTLWRTIKEEHPHITLFTCFGNVGYAPQELYNGYMDWCEDILHTIRTTAAYQLENVIEGVSYWLTPYTDAAFLADTLHPSQSGHFVIASQMIKIVNGCYQGTCRQGRLTNETLNTSLHWEYKDGKISFSIKPLNNSAGITLPENVVNNNLGALTFKPYIGTDVKRIYGSDMYVDWLTDTGVVKVRSYLNPNISGSDAFYLQAVGTGATGLLPITCPANQAVSDGYGQAF